ncbi:MAG: hypothetical protein JWN25_2716, partial [Verrucomicrobiales bacterium]|nr:hypothetical protein [Verrucomicrobiales bacterium]
LQTESSVDEFLIIVVVMVFLD